TSMRGRACGREGSDSLLKTKKRKFGRPPGNGRPSSFRKGADMATALERQRGSEPSVSGETKSGNAVLIDTLRRWGVRFFAGVNGGGVVHVAKHLEPYYELAH